MTPDHKKNQKKTITLTTLTLFQTQICVKTLKMYKDVGMASQKVCKQGRDDIKEKVNIQSPIPAYFSY